MKLSHVLVVLLAGLCVAADEKPKPPIVAKNLVAMVPKELLGHENAAVGEPFSVKRWNEWLTENVVGRDFIVQPEVFRGRVIKADDESDDKGGFIITISFNVPERPPGAPGNGESKEHPVVVRCVFSADEQPTLAKLGDGDTVKVTGRVRKAERYSYVLSGPTRSFEIVQHLVTLENAKLQITKRGRR